MPELLPVVAELNPEDEEFSSKARRHRNGSNRDLPVDLVVNGTIRHLRYVGGPRLTYGMNRFWYIFIDAMHEAYDVTDGSEHYFCILLSEDGKTTHVVQAMAIRPSRDGVPDCSVFLPAAMAGQAP